MYAIGNRWLQKQNDVEKKKLCLERGITLIEVPYWWDQQTKSLVATIRDQRPDIKFPSTLEGGYPISKVPSKGFPSIGLPELMHAEQWDGEQNLAGW